MEPDGEAAFKENLSDQGTKTSITVTGRSPGKPRRALANGAGPSQPYLANGLQQREESEGAVMLRQMMQRKPFGRKLQVEYYGLPPGVKVSLVVPLFCAQRKGGGEGGVPWGDRLCAHLSAI